MRLVNATPISLKDFREILMEIAGTVSRLFRKECHKYVFFFFFAVSCTVVIADSIVPHTNTVGSLSNYDDDHNNDFKKQ